MEKSCTKMEITFDSAQLIILLMFSKISMKMEITLGGEKGTSLHPLGTANGYSTAKLNQIVHIYRPHPDDGGGNLFRSVCLSFH